MGLSYFVEDTHLHGEIAPWNKGWKLILKYLFSTQDNFFYCEYINQPWYQEFINQDDIKKYCIQHDVSRRGGLLSNHVSIIYWNNFGFENNPYEFSSCMVLLTV